MHAEQAELETAGDGPGTVGRVEFFEDAGRVPADRPLRNAEQLGDAVVRESLPDEPQDLGFTERQPSRQNAGREPRTARPACPRTLHGSVAIGRGQATPRGPPARALLG